MFGNNQSVNRTWGAHFYTTRKEFIGRLGGLTKRVEALETAPGSFPSQTPFRIPFTDATGDQVTSINLTYSEVGNFNVGDMTNANNGVRFSLQDATGQILFGDTTNQSGGTRIRVSTTSNVVELGDPAGFNNNTFIRVDDANSEITFNGTMLLPNSNAYADDPAAATGGIAVGEVYWNTTSSRLKTRMT